MPSPTPDCYVVTGTGRCGSMLVQRLLALSDATRCVHELSVRYAKLPEAYLAETPADLYCELDDPYGVGVAAANATGRSFGEASALMFLCVPELVRRYDDRVRFVLLTRRAEDFVDSALARGFFDASHPHPLEHLRPRPDCDLARRWGAASPIEKCFWYWHVVNSTVLAAFDDLPPSQQLVQPIEAFDLAACERLYAFLGLPDFEAVRPKAESLLGRRINCTPGRGAAEDVNPWSVADTVESRAGWSEDEVSAYDAWAAPLMRRLYPPTPVR